MENLNQTNLEYFELRGFDAFEDYSPILFTTFFIVYILTIIGNVLIILVVYYNVPLHTPMYFFITNLSCLEIWYVSTTTPNLLTMLITKNKKISFNRCFAQIYMFHSLGMTECNLLAIMAVDRFVAICKPLRYNVIMSTRVCRDLSLMCWLTGFLMAIPPITLTSHVPFCGSYYVNHYFCDLPSLLSLACGDITVTAIINKFVAGFATMFNLAIVVLMYINIIISIMRMRINRGWKKAFSTCSSHLTVVTLFYGAACIVYAAPRTSHSIEYNKLFALVYAMFTPFLNPIIYSLRNQEVICGLKRGLKNIHRHIIEG
ncbi:olfactory receptor 6N1-like [Leptodactylus fuscus]|uniref:olfactory receptor 6N1-like n=1 Tax=Leptodactylus fuscus TaxID=238119 RepID=UPI003F4ECB4B